VTGASKTRKTRPTGDAHDLGDEVGGRFLLGHVIILHAFGDA
jgi:hypothetical protein